MIISKKEISYLTFYCPGCKRGHTVNGDWGYNNNPDKPTFSAHSIGVGNPSDPDYCHSWITDGMIKFETDSKHDLSGQTVELPHFPENYNVS
jgi:hypothetical protein